MSVGRCLALSSATIRTGSGPVTASNASRPLLEEQLRGLEPLLQKACGSGGRLDFVSATT